MGIDFNYYRRLNDLDNVPENNGNEFTTEILDRVSDMYWDSEDHVVTTYDLHKRQDKLIDATHQRYNSITNIKIWAYFKKIKEPLLNSLSRGVQADIGILKAGDYLTYTDKWGNKRETYMVKSKPEPQRTYDDAYMMYCNESLKWMDIDGNIKEYPCVVSHDKYVMGVYKDVVVETEASWVVIECQANPDTLRLRSGNRFLFRPLDSNVYYVHEVVDTNPHSVEGVILIRVKASKVVPDDNLELGIADYYSRLPEVVDENPVETLIVGSELLYIGSTNIYSHESLEPCYFEVVHAIGTLSVSKYLIQTIKLDGSLQISSVATSGSVGYEFDLILKKISDDSIVETKRIKVVDW